MYQPGPMMAMIQHLTSDSSSDRQKMLHVANRSCPISQFGCFLSLCRILLTVTWRCCEIAVKHIGQEFVVLEDRLCDVNSMFNDMKSDEFPRYDGWWWVQMFIIKIFRMLETPTCELRKWSILVWKRTSWPLWGDFGFNNTAINRDILW